MGALINELGNRYGRLLVVEKFPHTSGKARWLCLCDCGVHTTATGDTLRQGHKKSCGCFRREHSSTLRKIHGQSNSGGYKGKKCSRTYKSWQEMWARCRNASHISYKNYGARGITVDERWSDFSEFFKDMGDRPEGQYLDRVDGSKGYSAKNCKWSTRTEQNQNRRSCILMPFGDEVVVLAEWCRRLWLSYMATYKMLHRYGNLDNNGTSV